MRESSDGRGSMPPWGDASPSLQGQPAYAVGDRVCGAIDGIAGTVVAARGDCFEVRWTDGTSFDVVYPVETTLVRKAMPWE